MRKYRLVATGGTFDHFHRGHEALLRRAFEVGERVIIGVTSDAMVKREHKVLSEVTLPYEVRVTELKNFLKEAGYSGREVIAQLHGTFGPTVLAEEVEAVVCTRETRKGAVLINLARAKQGCKPAQIVECKFVVSEDGRHISSTRIRLGQIDRKGEIYSHIAFGTNLPRRFRDELSKPVGIFYNDMESVISQYKDAFFIVSVGDMVSASLKNIKRPARVEIVDGKVNREIYKDTVGSFNFTVRNPAGSVTPGLRKKTKQAIELWLARRSTVRVKVIGEEDLAVLPVLVWAPLGTVVVYGQPGYSTGKSGVVAVPVTEERKKWASELLTMFN